jgi:hypothetical protein
MPTLLNVKESSFKLWEIPSVAWVRARLACVGSQARVEGLQLRIYRHRSLAGAAVLCLALTAALVRPGNADSAIRPGTGIGPIRLGMTEQQVRRALGRPNTVHRSRAGRIYIVSLNYYMRGEYRVTLRGRRGAVRVSLVGTNSRRQRTSGGIGIGSSERSLREAYPNMRCRDVRGSGGGVIRRDCRVGARTRRHSVFVIGRGANPSVVIEVLVVAGIG